MYQEANKQNFKIWARKLDNSDTEGMSEEIGLLVINLLFGATISDEARETFLFKLITKRVDAMHSYILEDEATVVIAALCQTPGEAVIYCNYLQWWSDENDRPKITLGDLCQSIFPFGFFSHDTLYKAWEDQKLITGENMLDMICHKS